MGSVVDDEIHMSTERRQNDLDTGRVEVLAEKKPPHRSHFVHHKTHIYLVTYFHTYLLTNSTEQSPS
jgi:hypothetical protein